MLGLLVYVGASLHWLPQYKNELGLWLVTHTRSALIPLLSAVVFPHRSRVWIQEKWMNEQAEVYVKVPQRQVFSFRIEDISVICIFFKISHVWILNYIGRASSNSYSLCFDILVFILALFIFIFRFMVFWEFDEEFLLFILTQIFSIVITVTKCSMHMLPLWIVSDSLIIRNSWDSLRVGSRLMVWECPVLRKRAILSLSILKFQPQYQTIQDDWHENSDTQFWEALRMALLKILPAVFCKTLEKHPNSSEPQIIFV